MSNMSERSIDTRNEGPTHIDALAHELAGATLRYIGSDIEYKVLREVADKYSDASWVIQEADARHIRHAELLSALANEFAFMESLADGRDYNACYAKLLEWQRARRGLHALGHDFYTGTR